RLTPRPSATAPRHLPPFPTRRSSDLLRVPLLVRGLEMPHARQRSGNKHRRQAGREDEPGRIAADAVDDRSVGGDIAAHHAEGLADRKSTRLNSSHDQISYAVFCLKKK